MRLSRENLNSLTAAIATPRYSFVNQAVGIIHLGVVAFHRAHQAVYTDDAMNGGDSNFAILGVSMRSPKMAEQLNPQNGLYSVIERDTSQSQVRIIGSLSEVVTAHQHLPEILNTFKSVHLAVVTLTVTEKGYHQTPSGELDVNDIAVRADLSDSRSAQTIYGLLRIGLKARQSLKLPGVTLLSCDNLSHNGTRLKNSLATFLSIVDPSLAHWFTDNCTCPSSMVDRIVPAVTEDIRREAFNQLGMFDEGVVATEPFRQWVIEDDFAGRRPQWNLGNAQWVSDISVFEKAKLRLLNGAHSTLAYMGLRHGLTFVHEAISFPLIRKHVELQMRQESAPSLDPSFATLVDDYISKLLIRFSNQSLAHRLEQIATDGSQKITQRWLPVLHEAQLQGQSCPYLLTSLAYWIQYTCGGLHITKDPLAEFFNELWSTSDATGVVHALFGANGRFSTAFSPKPETLAQLTKTVQSLL